jgi:short-subunit dehydrogenase
MKGIVKQIEGAFGSVDVLVANAGSHVPTNLEQFDAREYDSLMMLNYSGALYCIEAVLPSMLERKSGHIVAVSSVAGYRGLPRAAAYGASKAALTHFIESIRFDLVKHGIAATVVSPGFVKTPLTDKNDFEMPFLIEAGKAAKIMLRGIERRKMEVHFPWQFTLIMKLLRIIPYPAYHKFILNKVVKQ